MRGLEATREHPQVLVGRGSSEVHVREGKEVFLPFAGTSWVTVRYDGEQRPAGVVPREGDQRARGEVIAAALLLGTDDGRGLVGWRCGQETIREETASDFVG